MLVMVFNFRKILEILDGFRSLGYNECSDVNAPADVRLARELKMYYTVVLMLFAYSKKGSQLHDQQKRLRF